MNGIYLEFNFFTGVQRNSSCIVQESGIKTSEQ
jgi:hypothetical protein